MMSRARSTRLHGTLAALLLAAAATAVLAQSDLAAIGGTVIVPGPASDPRISYLIPTTLSKLIGDSRASVLPSVDEAYEALAGMGGVEVLVVEQEQGHDLAAVSQAEIRRATIDTNRVPTCTLTLKGVRRHGS